MNFKRDGRNNVREINALETSKHSSELHHFVFYLVYFSNLGA